MVLYLHAYPNLNGNSFEKACQKYIHQTLFVNTTFSRLSTTKIIHWSNYCKQIEKSEDLSHFYNLLTSIHNKK